LNQQKQKEKEELSLAEKRLQEEKKLRASLEKQMAEDKKSRESHERQLQAANRSSKNNSTSSNKLNGSDSNGHHHNSECGEACQKKVRDFELENKALKDECNRKQERLNVLENELKSLSKCRENESTKADNSLIMKLNLMQDKNASLQESLSAETRFKLDLFSALGEARRQLEFANCKKSNNFRTASRLIFSNIYNFLRSIGG
jgi:hypothetical protein